MVYRTIIHLNIELQIPVIYRADFGLRGFTPLLLQILSVIEYKIEKTLICLYFCTSGQDQLNLQLHYSCALSWCDLHSNIYTPSVFCYDKHKKKIWHSIFVEAT